MQQKLLLIRTCIEKPIEQELCEIVLRVRKVEKNEALSTKKDWLRKEFSREQESNCKY